MRLSPAFVLSLLASAGHPSPIRRDIAQDLYTLRLASPEPTLNNLYLTTTTTPTATNVTSTTALGVSSTPASDPRAAGVVTFYAVHNPSTGLAELRTPTDGGDGGGSGGGGALAVVGAYGLFDLARVGVDPAGVDVPAGTTLDWTSFRLDEGAGTVEYAGGGGGSIGEGADGAQGRWVAFPAIGEESGWTVKWKDSTAWTTQNYVPVQVLYEPVKND